METILHHLIKHPKDFWPGLMFLLLGLAAVIFARDHGMGSAGNMGPAYFPTMLGWLLAGIGSAVMLRSLFKQGEHVSKFALKELFLILTAVLLFGILIRSAGLLPSVVVLVMASAVASLKFKLAPSLLLACGVAAFSVLVFVAGLGLPMPALGPWFGF